MHTYACVHVYVHTWSHTYPWSRLGITVGMHAYIHTHIHTHVYIHTYIHAYTQTHTHKRTRKQANTHMHIDTCMHTCTYTHMPRWHTHLCIFCNVLAFTKAMTPMTNAAMEMMILHPTMSQSKTSWALESCRALAGKVWALENVRAAEFVPGKIWMCARWLRTYLTKPKSTPSSVNGRLSKFVILHIGRAVSKFRVQRKTWGTTHWCS